MGGSAFYWVSAGIGVALVAAMCAYSWRLGSEAFLSDAARAEERLQP
jgi:hypothetical protein